MVNSRAGRVFCKFLGNSRFQGGVGTMITLGSQSFRVDVENNSTFCVSKLNNHSNLRVDYLHYKKVQTIT